MKIDANGVIGCVYKTQNGLEKYDSLDSPDFGTRAWEQITSNTRRLVVRKYSKSKYIIWIAKKYEEDCKPMNHKEDGELF